jgi:pimeloyl-ACP methyl ester carboxylesterase
VTTSDPSIRFSFVPANGITLHCAEAGSSDGPLLVLLHGFPEFWFAWREYLGPLAEMGFHVVAPDQRGYNLSGKPPGVDAYRLDVLAADIFALADHFRRETFQVAGHDWGAAVAWRMATVNPSRLQSVAILNAPHPAVWLSAMRVDPEQRRRSRYVQILRLPWLPEVALKLGGYSGLAKAFKSSVRPEAFGPEVLAAYNAAWRQPGALTAMLNWYRALFRQPAPMPAQGSLWTPTLILWGDKDEFGRSELADQSASLCANAIVRHLPEATHWIAHDAPETVRAALADFLRSDRER